MPGAPFLQISDSYQANAGQGVAASGPMGGYGDGALSHTTFLIWLVVLGVILPALVLGGLRAGGFQFVFKRR